MCASIDSNHLRNVLYSWPEMAMVLLYNNYYDKLIRIADKYTRNRQTSEDVLQEVFADIYKRHKQIGQVRGENIEQYVARAVRNRSVAHYQKRTRSAVAEMEYYYANAARQRDNRAEFSIIAEEQRQFVHVILGTFPAREKECLWLQVFRGMSVRLIAEQLCITEKAVEANLTRARKRLRRFGASLQGLL